MAGGGRLAGVDVADNHDVDVNLLLAHGDLVKSLYGAKLKAKSRLEENKTGLVKSASAGENSHNKAGRGDADAREHELVSVGSVCG